MTKTKKILMFCTFCLLLVVSVCFTTMSFMAKAESYEQNDGRWEIVFARSDWTSLPNTSSNPLGSLSGVYENIEVGLHSDGLQITMQVLAPYLISVGYSSGAMRWGNDIDFTLGSAQISLPSGTIWTAEPNKEYTLNGNYNLTVSSSAYAFPFKITFSYTNVNATTVNLNYEIEYDYLYMQGHPTLQYGVALPNRLAFTFVGLESSQVMFNYINAEFGTSNFTRVYNIGSSFGTLPQLPYTPDYIIGYYWAYGDSLDEPLKTTSTVENKQIYAVYTVDMSTLSSTILSRLQSYYNKGYDKGVEDGISQGNVLEKPLELWGGIFSQIGSFFNIELLPNITIGTLILIPTAFIIVLVILKLVRG